MAGAPFSCSSSSDVILQRAGRLRRLADQALRESRRTTTGARLRFTASPEVESELREFVRWENDCCPFLDFTVRAEQGEICLDVRGPEEASGIIDLLVALTGTKHR